MQHQLKIEDFTDHWIRYSFADSRGKKSNKSLMVVVPVSDLSRAVFRVVSYGKTIIETANLAEAIEAYNQEP